MSTAQIKICGLTNRDDAAAALDLGVDYIGFVLYAGSPRGIEAATLAHLLDQLRSPFRAVAVFVNESRTVVEQVATDCGLFAVQIHGDEAAADFAGVQPRLWRAVRRFEGNWVPDPARWPAERYVVDAAGRHQYGGSGMTGDWREAGRLARQVPVMLAGGLTPDNVAEAIRRVNPAGVDVASGIEAEPGRKDLQKMRLFVERARSTETGGEP